MINDIEAAAISFGVAGFVFALIAWLHSARTRDSMEQRFAHLQITLTIMADKLDMARPRKDTPNDR